MGTCCSLVFLALPCTLVAQVKANQKNIRSPREFVEEFYRWYVPQALSDKTITASDIAIKYRSSDLSPQLFWLLREDAEAQARCAELIGIDFDPFLASQDPAERYIVGEVSRKDRSYWAKIYSVQSGNRSERPDLIVEFQEENRHWFFVNFYYAGNSDLLTILKSPRPECTVPRSSKDH